MLDHFALHTRTDTKRVSSFQVSNCRFARALQQIGDTSIGICAPGACCIGNIELCLYWPSLCYNAQSGKESAHVTCTHCIFYVSIYDFHLSTHLIKTNLVSCHWCVPWHICMIQIFTAYEPDQCMIRYNTLSKQSQWNLLCTNPQDADMILGRHWNGKQEGVIMCAWSAAIQKAFQSWWFLFTTWSEDLQEHPCKDILTHIVPILLSIIEQDLLPCRNVPYKNPYWIRKSVHDHSSQNDICLAPFLWAWLFVARSVLSEIVYEA